MYIIFGGGKLKKEYMVWWHSYVDDLNHEETTIKEVYDSVSKALEELNKLKVLEQNGKIKVKNVGTLNPLFIEILDKSIESEVENNPIVDVGEAK
jgi:hypothetical protein